MDIWSVVHRTSLKATCLLPQVLPTQLATRPLSFLCTTCMMIALDHYSGTFSVSPPDRSSGAIYKALCSLFPTH